MSQRLTRTHPMIVGIALTVLLGTGCNESVPRPDVSVSASETSLNLSGRGLETVPSSVFEMISLEELDLSDNALTGALPSQIGRLQRLRVLDASGNRMTGVPAEIGQLRELRELDLSDNALTGLPLELGNLTSLQRLDLRGNETSARDLDAIRAKLTNTEILTD